MKITVVIPALDEEREITGSIESAQADSVRSCGALGTGPGASESVEGGIVEGGIEVVVVDGGSADRTVDVAEAAGARVIRSRPGRARQLQAGVEASVGEWLLFLHADTRLPPGWAVAVSRAFRDPGVVGGAFRLRFDRQSAALAIVEWGVRLRVALFGLPYGDQALFVRRRVLEEIGGVPDAPLMEDLDLVKAMKRRGRIEILSETVTTSARRHVEGGVLRTAVRHLLAASLWAAGVDRERVAAWTRR